MSDPMTDRGYGGKTRDEEAHDSVVALAWVMVYIGVSLAIIGCLLVWWLL